MSYDGNSLSAELRIDLVVAAKVIVECKATAEYNPVFAAQALTYLRVSGLKLAMVINFGKSLVKDGIRRIVNGL
jgi:GxxExxY protein